MAKNLLQHHAALFYNSDRGKPFSLGQNYYCISLKFHFQPAYQCGAHTHPSLFGTLFRYHSLQNFLLRVLAWVKHVSDTDHCQGQSEKNDSRREIKAERSKARATIQPRIHISYISVCVMWAEQNKKLSRLVRCSGGTNLCENRARNICRRQRWKASLKTGEKPQNRSL